MFSVEPNALLYTGHWEALCACWECTVQVVFWHLCKMSGFWVPMCFQSFLGFQCTFIPVSASMSAQFQQPAICQENCPSE